MFSRIFRGGKRRDQGLASDDRQQRLSTLAEITEPDADELEKIIALARQDADADVRRAAIGKITDTDLLADMLDDAEVGESAARRIVSIDPDTRQRHRLISSALLAAGVVPDPAFLKDVPAPELVDLVIASRGDARTRLLEQDAFLLPETLNLLERHSRNKDKSLNRFARAKLDAVKHKRAERSRQTERLHELITALQKHLNSDRALPGHQDKHQQLLDRAEASLAELDAAATELAKHGEAPGDIDSLRQTLAAIPAPAQKAAAVSDDDPFSLLAAEFERLGEDLRSSHDFEELTRRRHELTDRWLAAADKRAPDEQQHRLFQQIGRDYTVLAEAMAALTDSDTTPREADLAPQPPQDPKQVDGYWEAVAESRRWLKRSNSFLNRLQWPHWAPEPETLTIFRQRLDAVQDILSQLDAHAAGRLRKLESDIAELENRIDQGESKAAQSLLKSTRALLKQLPRRDTEKLSRSLNQAAARLGDLKDWQTFATTPKRQSLCEEMASLAASPLEPSTQATRIRTLREQWNELGPPSQGADRDLAEQFNSLAEQAFEPCRQHFADQAQQREENLKARVDICEQLSHYLETTDWSQTDIKAAEQILRTAREAWRRYHPVERKPGKPLEERFELLQSTLHGHIKAEWDRNLALKKSIVAEATALLNEDVPVIERVNGAKNLQQRWRDVGTTPRRPDQQLWREFRGICDRIFESRDTEKQAADAEVESNRTAARQLIDNFSAAMDEVSGQTLREFQSRYEALPPLPDRLSQALNRDFRNLVERAEDRLRTEARAARLRELTARVDAEPLDDNAPDDGAEALRRKVIEAEIAAEIASPDTDRELRMIIQVELMNAGRGAQALAAEPKALVDEWLDLGPKPSSALALRERFNAAISKLSA
jgi:hypothetical protein